MQNVTATNSKRFKLSVFKKVLFIVVSFDIDSRMSTDICFGFVRKRNLHVLYLMMFNMVL